MAAVSNLWVFSKSLTYNICINIYTTENPFIGYYCFPNLTFQTFLSTGPFWIFSIYCHPKLIFKQEWSLDFDISKKGILCYVLRLLANSWSYFQGSSLQSKIFSFLKNKFGRKQSNSSDLLNQNPWSGTLAICLFKKSSKWFWKSTSFRNNWSDLLTLY